jgi:diaminopimelate decarboxylase/aspartate kinase
VYNTEVVAQRARSLLALNSVDRVLYAIKANPHPVLLRLLAGLGVGLECVSPGELERVFEAIPGLDPERVLFTPNFAPRREYQAALNRGVHLTLDNLHPLQAWSQDFAGAKLLLRIDPGQGKGHHRHVRTAGNRSKFGIALEELDQARSLVDAAGATVVGLHAHAGSGIRTAGHWAHIADTLTQVSRVFPDVRVLDLGGGLGVPEKPTDKPLDLAALDASLAGGPKHHRLWLEPGRFLVAEAGVLLATVTQVKSKGSQLYVGIDAGMNSLIRPALYGAWHEIVNLSRWGEPICCTANVVGPICETGDTLGAGRRLPETHEGDVLLIATAGAYGHAMASHYNLRAPAAEVILDETGTPPVP